MAKIIKNSFLNFFVILVIFSLVGGWFYFGWPQIWQNPPIPPKIQEAQAAFNERTETNAQGSTLTSPYQVTLAVPAGTTNGDLMFTWIGSYSATVTTNAAWTLLGSYTAASDKYYLYARVASSEPASYVWTFSATSKYKATCTTYIASSDFDVSNVATDLTVSNTSYRISNATNRAASFSIPTAYSPILFFGGVYSSASKTQTPPTNPGAFTEDYDTGGTVPDFWLEISYYIWSGSGDTGNIDSTISATLTTKHAFAVALKPGPVTILATGSDPSINTIGPGAATTDVNTFTLQTNIGTETISDVAVNLSTNSGIGRLAITDNSDNELGYTTSPTSGSNIISVSGMSAGTSVTTFKVRATPKAHGDMPSVPGGSYDITAPVTAWTGTGSYTHTGSDTNTNALTIDNASPSDASWGTITPGDQQIELNWSNPGDSDFNKVLILRKAGSTISDTPTEGQEYYVPGSIADSTIIYVNNGTTFTDTGLTNGTNYFYKIFAYDNYLNSAAGTETGPHAPESVPATVSCSTNIATTSFSTWTDTSIKTASPNASTSMSCSSTSGGCTLYVKDAGSGSNPGLWRSTSPTKLIPSPNAAFSTTATLSAGTEGYGIQATTTSVDLNIATRYLQTSNTVGGLTLGSQTLASSTADISSAEVIVTHKAAISDTTFSGSYTDTIIYECVVN